MVRGALASLLSLEGDIEVVAEVERGDEVLEAARSCAPDVALLDIELPGRDGIALVADIRGELPATRTLILTTSVGPATCSGRSRTGPTGSS